MRRLVSGLDLETSGLDQAKGHRIIEVGIQTYDLDTRQLVDEYVQRIDPERAIDAGAQEVHGISYTELVGMPKWAAVAPIIVDKFKDTSIAVAHNMDFDGPFLGAELIRVGQPIPSFDLFCTMQNGRWATFDGKSPRLGELAFALGVPYDPSKAHGALYDVSIMIECLWRGIDRGFYKLPE